MAGEELPPVVAVLEGDDGSFLAMLERDIQAAKAFGTDLQLALTEAMGGVTFSGAQISGEGVGAAGAVIGEEFSAGIAEGLGGLDVAPEIGREFEAVGGAAGEQLAAGIESAVSGLGVELAQEIGEPLSGGLADAGASGGEALNAELSASTATIGEVLASRISEQLSLGLDAAAQASMGILGQINLAGLGGTLASSFSGAGLLAGLSGLSAGMAEAGSAAGDALAAALGDSAAQGAAAASVRIGAGFEAALSDTASEAGAAAGDSLIAGLGDGARAGAGEAAVRVAEALQAPLVAAMDGVGAEAAAGFSAALAESAHAAESIPAAVAAAAPAAQSAAAEVGAGAAEALAAEFAASDALFAAAGTHLGDALVSAMADVLGGLEPQIEGMTQQELAALERFYATMQADGEAAAIALAGQMRMASEQAVSAIDFMDQGLTTFGVQIGATGSQVAALAEEINAPLAVTQQEIDAMGAQIVAVSRNATASLGDVVGGFDAMKAAGAGAGIGADEIGAASEKAAGAMSGLMAGPAGMLLYSIPMMLPMIAQSFSSSAISAATFTQAVQQDSNAVGDNTAATIQNALAKTDLNSMAQVLGVTQAQLIEYAAGEADAQNAVAAAYKRVDDYEQAHTSNAVAGLQQQKAQLDEVTAAVAQAIGQERSQTDTLIAAEHTTQIYQATVANLVSTMRQQAEQAHMSADATGAFLMELSNPGGELFTNAVNAQVIALQQNAIQAQISTDALNKFLMPEGQISTEALNAVNAFQQASAATNLYTGAVNALYGQYGQTSGALAAANLAVSNLTGKITDGKDAVNLYTDAGDKNFQQFQQAAQAAESYAEKLYQQTGDTDQATAALQTFAEKIDHAATEAHLTKGQIDDLNTALFGVPDVKDITIHLDPTPAQQQMTALDTFIQGEINSINNTPITPTVQGRNIPARAGGGPVVGGEAYVVGENRRPEVFVPGASGFITPMDMLTPAASAPGAAGGGYGFGGSEPVTVVANIYLDGNLVGRQVSTGTRDSTQMYARRNDVTGFVAVGH